MGHSFRGPPQAKRGPETEPWLVAYSRGPSSWRIRIRKEGSMVFGQAFGISALNIGRKRPTTNIFKEQTHVGVRGKIRHRPLLGRQGETRVLVFRRSEPCRSLAGL